MAEVRESVVIGLRFVEGYLPEFVSGVFEGSEIRPRAKGLHRLMRTRLPVPAIFCTLRILFRLQGFLHTKAEALDKEQALELPASENHVDHTVKNLFRALCDGVDQYMVQNSDWKDHDWNPYHRLREDLKGIIKYNSHVFFGITFYDDDEEEEG